MKRLHRPDRPATGPQLWRLNSAGLLHTLAKPGQPITVGEAAEAIAALSEEGAAPRG